MPQASNSFFRSELVSVGGMPVGVGRRRLRLRSPDRPSPSAGRRASRTGRSRIASRSERCCAWATSSTWMAGSITCASIGTVLHVERLAQLQHRGPGLAGAALAAWSSSCADCRPAAATTSRRPPGASGWRARRPASSGRIPGTRSRSGWKNGDGALVVEQVGAGEAEIDLFAVGWSIGTPCRP